jgi:TolB-like protein/Tfp pilus assembly protein PilF/tRNA A-37 threonylcarbamoyl transferase component Bud32
MHGWLATDDNHKFSPILSPRPCCRAAPIPHLSTSKLIARIQPALAARYQLERPLPGGGMAVVFAARDARHDRRVALKVLLPELATTVGPARFVREIRYASRLTHPHILPVLDSGEAAGLPYYVMPFIDGESLRDRLTRERVLSVENAVRLTEQVADALAYAHAAGSVRRDSQPENILLLGGHALVADFGIARAITAAADEAEVTATGMTVGTPAYMSPEQAAGDAVIDGRSDIYSLATVFFEMIAGHTPFAGASNRAMITRRFVEQAPRLRAVCGDLPIEIDEVVADALAIESADRPADVAAFSNALRVASHGVDWKMTIPARLTAAAHATPARPLGFSSPDASMPSIAVLPFANLSGNAEDEFFSDGITEEIIAALSRLRTIRVAARTSSFAFKGKHQDVRTIAERLGVASVLEGSVRRAGSRVRVHAQLIDAQSGHEVWSNQIDREFSDIFAMQDEIADAIAMALKATLLSGAARSVGPSVAGHVYEHYLRGRYALNKRTEPDLQKAVGHFADATEADPEFALAYAGLGDALAVLGIYGASPPVDVMPVALDAAERALAIDPSLAEAHATIGVVHATFEWDWPAAESAFQRAIALGPRYSTAHQWCAMNYLVPMRRFDEALAAISRAVALDPLSLVIRVSSGVIKQFAGDTAGAIADLEAALDLDPGYPMTHYFLGSARRDAGDLDESVRAFEEVMTRVVATPEMISGLGQTLARRGDLTEALKLRDRLRTAASSRHVASSTIAQLEIALGETDSALAYLEQAVEERDADLIFLAVRRSYNDLRGNPRFQAVRKRIGLP